MHFQQNLYIPANKINFQILLNLFDKQEQLLHNCYELSLFHKLYDFLNIVVGEWLGFFLSGRDGVAIVF